MAAYAAEFDSQKAIAPKARRKQKEKKEETWRGPIKKRESSGFILFGRDMSMYVPPVHFDRYLDDGMTVFIRRHVVPSLTPVRLD